MFQVLGVQLSLFIVYYEWQCLELCVVYVFNNVLQQQFFSQEVVDEICKRLVLDFWLNFYCSFLGIGNYDVNVIMVVLQGLGLVVVWWDRRRFLFQLVLFQVLGLILNLFLFVLLGLLLLLLCWWYWVVLCQVDGVYYNLDFKLWVFEVLGDEDGVRVFLVVVLVQGLCEVLLVVIKEVEEKGSWLWID